MNCKSCDQKIKSSDGFCSSCGSRIMNKRLTIGGIKEELVESFFDWDNVFMKTFLHLFTQPKAVLDAYISGARKKYFKPFSFLIGYASLALFFFKFFPMPNPIKINISDDGGGKIAALNFLNNLDAQFYEYYNFYIILSIPIIALFAYLTFKKLGNNYAEHLVFQSYIQSLIGYVSLLLQLIFLHLLELNSNIYSLISFLFIVVYWNYVFIKYYDISLKKALWANLKFIGIIIITALVSLLLVLLIIIIFA